MTATGRGDRCKKEPCRHKGQCVQANTNGHRSWQCQCAGTGFYGTRCGKSKCHQKKNYAMSLLVTSLGTTPRYAGIFRRYLLCKTYLLIQTYVTATVNHKIANVIPHIDWNVGLQRINTKRGTFRGRSEPVGAPFLENHSHRLSALWVLPYLNSFSENSYPKKIIHRSM